MADWGTAWPEVDGVVPGEEEGALSEAGAMAVGGPTRSGRWGAALPQWG